MKYIHGKRYYNSIVPFMLNSIPPKRITHTATPQSNILERLHPNQMTYGWAINIFRADVESHNSVDTVWPRFYSIQIKMSSWMGNYEWVKAVGVKRWSS